ncbi:MAG TPA: hypothetical protein DSN98_03380 [Thermoplasmata archaeon]|nr:MAG TPA: hypothetical protein DSN98_03380 [Thermoplasmata archaeon]
MKNKLIGRIIHLSAARYAGGHITVLPTETMSKIHDSVIVSTLEVKGYGKSLLIKLPEATSWLVTPGNTLLPAIPRVFPVREMSVS